MLVLHVIKHVNSVDVCLLYNGVQSHLVMIQFACVDHQIFHDCIDYNLLSVGGSKLIASLFGAKLSETGLRTSFFVSFGAFLDIAGTIDFLFMNYSSIFLKMQQQQQIQSDQQADEFNKQQEGQKDINGKPICQFYVMRKKRYCKFEATKGSKYCANHCSDLDKIECPYEKGCFVSAKIYQKHLKNCPKLATKRKQQSSQWFSKDINKVDEINQQRHDINIVTLSEVEDEVIDKIVKQIINLYLKTFKQQELLHFIESSEKEVLQNTTNDHMQAQLITQKAFQNKLISPELIYVEFGAGKGILSYAISVKIQEAYQKHSYNILLERQSRRNKFDKYFKDNPYFQRYKGDVSNFDFKLLPKTMTKSAIEKCKLTVDPEDIEIEIGKRELIGVCKHMCGEALDISMRGLLQGNSKGCILASCCHQLCNYNTYLNPKFFERQGLTSEQIQILFKISSWGTKSHLFGELSIDIFEHLRNKGYIHLLADEKILIGRMCKRLIDVGRAQFLGGNIFRYCSDQLTPQNYVIITKN